MKKQLLIILVFCFNLCISQNTIQVLTLSAAALELTEQKVTYDPSYFSIDYPNGDVPSDKGGLYRCSD